MREHFADNIEIFICPACGGALSQRNDLILCNRCRRSYHIDHGIPLLYCAEDSHTASEGVTETVKAFYERTLFPNYGRFEHVGDLIEKARTGIFARLLDEQLPYNVRILEVGCGTGQLSNFLGLAQRSVFGTDMSVGSLKLAQEFKTKHHLERIGFYQMNLFKPVFKEETFPVVICQGVLHHTNDPLGGFRTICRLVQKGGYIIIGLYNVYGRISTDIRRVVIRIFGKSAGYLDPYLQREDVGEEVREAWFCDQYLHPHESKHTFGEVIKWFSQNDFIFVNSIPKLLPFSRFSDNEKLFIENKIGSGLDHFITQAGFIFSGFTNGGLFIMIGKRAG